MRQLSKDSTTRRGPYNQSSKPRSNIRIFKGNVRNFLAGKNRIYKVVRGRSCNLTKTFTKPNKDNRGPNGRRSNRGLRPRKTQYTRPIPNVALVNLQGRHFRRRRHNHNLNFYFVLRRVSNNSRKSNRGHPRHNHINRIKSRKLKKEMGNTNTIRRDSATPYHGTSPSETSIDIPLRKAQTEAI